MLHADEKIVRQLLLKGNFGLEKESLRVYPDGHMSHAPHPFSDEEHITRDFSENQTEINTGIRDSAEAAIAELLKYTNIIERKLSGLERPELLWPFSNPAYIEKEDDVPIAVFEGENSIKTAYRECLSDRYGRYKMTLCGIHINYSFADELLKEDFKYSGFSDFTEYKNDLYVTLAEKAAAYGWIVTAVTAASPLMDSSFIEKHVKGKTVFNGMASTRCSELGYWNYFTPVFDYSDLKSYAGSIQDYVDNGLLISPSELYYPVRLKSKGRYDLARLRDEGADHIELRMVDLNPMESSGLNIKDLKFAQLLLVWLAATKRQPLSLKDQVQAAQNFKNAAHFDLKTVKIVAPNNEVYSVIEAGLKVIGFMKEFYKEFSEDIKEILDFEEAKLIDNEKRYAWKVKQDYSGDFVKKGISLAAEMQKEALALKDNIYNPI